MNGLRFLVVDDDPAIGVVLDGLLRQMDVEPTVVDNAARAIEALARGEFDCVVTDLRMPGVDGMQLLSWIVERFPDLPVVVLSAHGTIPIAVEAMKRGASDFLTKPFEREELVRLVDKIAALQRRSCPPPSSALGLVGSSQTMEHLRGLIRRAARSAATVLIRGETGTGKELVALSIHRESERRDMPLVVLHCAALPETLLESELFGYEKGAFTGANTSKPGKVLLAEGGTLFLDEIGDVSPVVQVKLLRLLQEREYQPLGSTKMRKANVRFVAATHRNIEVDIREGRFREDLFYRLNVVSIWVPALRERRDDIVELIEHFRRATCQENHRDVSLHRDAIEALGRHAWPGNVRELRNVIERLIVLATSHKIGADQVLAELQQSRGDSRFVSTRRTSGLTATKEELLQILKQAGNNRTLAARLLGVSRRTLYNRLTEFGIRDVDDAADVMRTVVTEVVREEF